KNDPLETLQKQLAERNELIDQQTKNIEAAKKKGELYSVEIMTLKRAMSKAAAENETLRKELAAAKSSYALMLHEAEGKAAAMAAARLEQRVHEVRAEERARLGQEVASLQAEVGRLGGLLATQADGLKEQAAADGEELAALRLQLEERDRELAEAADREQHLLDRRNQEVTSLEAKVTRLTAERDQLEVASSQQLAASSEAEALQLEIKNLKAELSEAASQRAQLEASLGELKSQQASTERAKATAQTDSDSLKAQLARLEAEKAQLAAAVATSEKEAAAVTAHSDELNSRLGASEGRLSSLTAVLKKALGLAVDSEGLQASLEELKTKASQYEALSGKHADLSELLEQVTAEKEALRGQLDSLKHGNKEEAKMSQEYSSALQETEKILNEMQEKYLKSKNEQNQKLEELERLLAEKGEEEETVKEELSKCRENIDQLSRVNDGLTGQLRDLKELVSSKEAVIAGFKAKEEGFQEDLEKIKEENKTLNSKIVKLNNLVQIGKHSFQEESEKVQNLESMLNGKETAVAAVANNGNSSTPPTSNGNGSS
ncbi:PREDICTED: major antigen-like, partial [Rhagoletis zephyria]|uniref:major antigen-like n=1 Tax=Rhagoletis zephyria TaxID=28612 RepID=UPI0008114FE9